MYRMSVETSRPAYGEMVTVVTRPKQQEFNVLRAWLTRTGWRNEYGPINEEVLSWRKED